MVGFVCKNAKIRIFRECIPTLRINTCLHMSKMDVKGGTSKVQDYDQSLAMYLQTTHWPLRFDCSPYSQPISLKVGYVFIATLSLPSMYSDLF